MLCCLMGFGTLNSHCLYSLVFREAWTWAISFLRQSGRVIMTSARLMSVRTTDLLCCRWWLELKFKYWSVWVSLPYTMTCVLPSSLMFTLTSRKGNLPSCSGSIVNLMLESRLLKWVVNSSTWYSWITVNVSSTYLNPSEGWGWGLCREQSHRILPYIGLLLWATLVIPWLLRVSVCISLPCMWNRWCSGRNSVVQVYSPVTEGYDLGDLGPRPIWCGLLWWHLVAGCWCTVLKHRMLSVSIPVALNFVHKITTVLDVAFWFAH